jgi:hypothetical protein
MVAVFRPGNKAPFSGVYKVTHAHQHAEPHYVTLLFGDTFPVCLTCFKRPVRTRDVCRPRERAPAFSACCLKMRLTASMILAVSVKYVLLRDNWSPSTSTGIALTNAP